MSLVNIMHVGLLIAAPLIVVVVLLYRAALNGKLQPGEKKYDQVQDRFEKYGPVIKFIAVPLVLILRGVRYLFSALFSFLRSDKSRGSSTVSSGGQQR